MEHLMLKLEKTLMLGKIEGKRRGDSRGWDGWMASPTEWTWVWASSRSWWQMGKPGVLQSTGSQRVGHHWVTELNWTESGWSPWYLEWEICGLLISYMGGAQLCSAPAIASIHWRQSPAVYPVLSLFLTENVKRRLVVNCLTWSPSISFLG